MELLLFKRRKPASGKVVLEVINWGETGRRGTVRYTLKVVEVLVGTKRVMRVGTKIVGDTARILGNRLGNVEVKRGFRFEADFKMDEYGVRTFTNPRMID